MITNIRRIGHHLSFNYTSMFNQYSVILPIHALHVTADTRLITLHDTKTIYNHVPASPEERDTMLTTLRQHIEEADPIITVRQPTDQIAAYFL